MAVVRVCLVLVMLVCIDSIAGKPFFGYDFWCDLFCDYDDDDSSSTTTSNEDSDYCDDCRRPRRRTTTIRATTLRPTTAMMGGPNPSSQTFNISMPPGNGMNIMMENTGSFWNMMLMPWSGATMTPAASGQVTTTKSSATTRTVMTTTAAGATTAAAATTAAGATTAAPAATTTAAAGK